MFAKTVSGIHKLQGWDIHQPGMVRDAQPGMRSFGRVRPAIRSTMRSWVIDQGVPPSFVCGGSGEHP
jgi:hypothetical protein